ncbi:hypothetical protein PR048_008829 [Dryococelus australis]|uniref:FHA domain-containing protein n=1 Tax=Dryococelus australis TaxID=614101 RepID=A0ABQ9HZ88_9NEOP|nr:hypothetical protein PR048_008829 [Dryococelus australis]
MLIATSLRQQGFPAPLISWKVFGTKSPILLQYPHLATLQYSPVPTPRHSPSILQYPHLATLHILQYPHLATLHILQYPTSPLSNILQYPHLATLQYSSVTHSPLSNILQYPHLATLQYSPVPTPRHSPVFRLRRERECCKIICVFEFTPFFIPGTSMKIGIRCTGAAIRAKLTLTPSALSPVHASLSAGMQLFSSRYVSPYGCLSGARIILLNDGVLIKCIRGRVRPSTDGLSFEGCQATRSIPRYLATGHKGHTRNHTAPSREGTHSHTLIPIPTHDHTKILVDSPEVHSVVSFRVLHCHHWFPQEYLSRGGLSCPGPVDGRQSHGNWLGVGPGDGGGTECKGRRDGNIIEKPHWPPGTPATFTACKTLARIHRESNPDCHVKLYSLYLSGATVAERLARLPPTKANGFNPRPGHRIFASGNRAGRWRWSVGFLGDLPFPPPFHSGAAPYSLQSPSSLPKSLHLTSIAFAAAFTSPRSSATGAEDCGNFHQLVTRDGKNSNPLSPYQPHAQGHVLITATWTQQRLQQLAVAMLYRKAPPASAPPYVISTYTGSMRAYSLSVVTEGVLEQAGRRPTIDHKFSTGERSDPRENPPTNGIVQRDSHMRKSGVTRPCIESISTWWEASRLTARPPWPPCDMLIIQKPLGGVYRATGWP